MPWPRSGGWPRPKVPCIASTPALVHFHEVGALDAIVDVVGACAALEVLGIDDVQASAVALGVGTITTHHGVLPNPPPAVLALLEGAPTYGVDVDLELTTPTGAALLAALVSAWGPSPPMTLRAVGYGAGGRDLPARANVTQVVVGDAAATTPLTQGQPVMLLEANVDDTTGEVLAHAISALLARGAHDAWVTPIVMKKGRPAHTVHALCDPALADAVAATLVAETGSLGLRGQRLERWPQARTESVVSVGGEPVRVKVGAGRVKAEHDDAAAAAARLALPLREVLHRAEALTSRTPRRKGRTRDRPALTMTVYDAVIVGSGPNGLTAAARLAQAGARVVVLERAEHPGGGTRSGELLVPGVTHDICSTVHPFGAASPAFKALRLEDHGLAWVHPPVALAHPFDDGSAVALDRSLEETAHGLGADGDRYRHLCQPLLDHWDDLLDGVMGPPVRIPRHPLTLGRFGAAGMLPITWIARRFETPRARALLAGLAAHSVQPLGSPFTGALGLSLALAAHACGWPFAKGGSQAIADALVAVITAAGGEVVTRHEVTRLADLPPARVVLLDVTPSQLVTMANGRLDGWAGRPYRRFRHGPGACKVDYVLSEPMPWTSSTARRAGTLHLGGTLDELRASEAAPSHGRIAERPFVLAAQPVVADPSRAPAGDARAVGLLPRAARLTVRCHRPHRRPARPVRAGLA